ncbi:hypothetical protein O9K51_01867 [Purpureocillium lavendulum]|uniref:Uncharacterized protein n=1 Tax=Purpureocillium lavendulum TaxID=1247861 RepID=A0AB34G8L5_9HYPO|nr:hypothetical protein O9K51_01867 [Purpureocillium lavendulum]
MAGVVPVLVSCFAVSLAHPGPRAYEPRALPPLAAASQRHRPETTLMPETVREVEDAIAQFKTAGDFDGAAALANYWNMHAFGTVWKPSPVLRLCEDERLIRFFLVAF